MTEGSAQPPRIPLIAREDWTDAARDVFAVMDGQEAWENGSRFNVVNILALHPAIAAPYLRFSRSLLFDTGLSPRLREIMVLRMAHLSHCEYMWVQHVRIGTSLGLNAADIEAIRTGQLPGHWHEIDGLAFRAVDELDVTDTISDGLWDSLSKYLDHRRLLEILWIVGAFKASAWIFNAVRVPLENSNPIRINFAGA